MIYLSLPYAYRNIKFNNNFQYILKRHPEYLKEEIICLFNHGSFPYTIWNGDVNNNNGELLLHDDLIKNINIFGNSFCLNCSNILLEENDFYNRYMNQILNFFDYSSNYIELSNLNLFKFLKEKYPNYRYVFSEKANELKKFNSDIINAIIETNNFNYIILPSNMEEEELKKIKNKNKTFILIGNKCKKCANYRECLIKENESQLDFSKYSIYNNCNKVKEYITAKELEKEISYYKSLGFNHFKIDSPPNDFNVNTFNLLIIETFIKPEYQFEAIKELS